MKKIIFYFISICTILGFVMFLFSWASPLSMEDSDDMDILTAELTILHNNDYKVTVNEIGELGTYFDKTYQLVTYTISNDSTQETKQVKVELEKNNLEYRFKQFIY